MKARTLWGVGLLFGSLSVCSPSWAAGATKLREAVEAGNRQFTEAAAKGDAAAMAALYTESGQAFPPGGEVVSGRQALKDFWQAVLDSGVKEAKLETVEVAGTGDFAFEAGKYTLLGAQGEALEVGKYVVVWKREQGKWRLHRDIWNSNQPPEGD